MALHPFGAVVPVSATKNQQLDQLLQEIAARLPEANRCSKGHADRPSHALHRRRTSAREIFRLVGDELPYGCTVVIEQWEERQGRAHRRLCRGRARQPQAHPAGRGRHAHKKRIATEARQDIAKLLDKTVHLEVYIKVRKGWSDREGALRDLGYGKRAPRVQDRQDSCCATAWRETSSFKPSRAIMAVAAGSPKRPYSMLRPVLSAFQPLLLSWTGNGESRRPARKSWAYARWAAPPSCPPGT